MDDDAIIHYGLGHAVGQIMGVFYADYGPVGSRYPELIQVDINVLISLFQRIGLMANVSKSKTMTCQPGIIR